MLDSTLGRTGRVVPRLALGTMTFTGGGGNAAIARTGAADADRLVLATADVHAGRSGKAANQDPR